MAKAAAFKVLFTKIGISLPGDLLTVMENQMKTLFLMTISAVLIGSFTAPGYSVGLNNSAKKSKQTRNVEYSLPQAAVRAFIPAWRR